MQRATRTKHDSHPRFPLYYTLRSHILRFLASHWQAILDRKKHLHSIDYAHTFLNPI